jgi:multiple sugar transport system substrate-binding protein
MGISQQVLGSFTRRRAFATASGVAIAALALTGCSSSSDGAASGSSDSSSSGGDVVTEITVWAQEGQESEVQAAKDEIEAFNSSQSAIHATLTLVPQATYGQTLTTTSADALPDVFEFDGETLGALVYAGKLAPLDALISQATFDNELTSIQAQGKYSDGVSYSVSQYDSGLALFGNKSMLEAAGVTNIPTTLDGAWTADEFDAVLKQLAAANPEGKALDIKEQYAGTWPGYAFTPVVASAGQPLVGSDGKADGHLNAPDVVKAVERFASWRQYVDPDADDKAFTDKRVGLAWVGHWTYQGNATALGDDLVVIPLPDFGNGTKSGQGSHSWGLGAKSPNQEAGAAFLEFIMQDEWVSQITEGNGAVPATATALAASAIYAADGPLALYGQQLAESCGSADPTPTCVTVPRTISPAWPVINQKFSEAFWAIYTGADAQSELDKAATAIDQDSADNNGYK